MSSDTMHIILFEMFYPIHLQTLLSTYTLTLSSFFSSSFIFLPQPCSNFPALQSSGTMMLSSSVEVPSPGGMSGLSGLSAAARNVVRSSSISGAMYSLEKSPGSGCPDSTSLAGNKKRRSSLGAKMVAIVGLSQWSKSTQQLNQQGQFPVQNAYVGLKFFLIKLHYRLLKFHHFPTLLSFHYIKFEPPQIISIPRCFSFESFFNHSHHFSQFTASPFPLSFFPPPILLNINLHSFPLPCSFFPFLFVYFHSFSFVYLSVGTSIFLLKFCF